MFSEVPLFTVVDGDDYTVTVAVPDETKPVTKKSMVSRC